MNRIYTMQDWERNGSFNAAPGQQIEPAIYEHFYERMPIQRLPRNEITAKYRCGFMICEAYDSDPDTHRPRYAAFGRIKDGRYYFIGYLSR